jgi:hypothetical protein
MKSNTSYYTDSIKSLIEDLEKEAISNEKLAKHGSPVTSMSEDYEVGEIAKEQRRIIKLLKKIIE